MISQDTTFTLHNIIPNQFNISKISLTKISIEFKENSLFGKNVSDLAKLSDALNNILIYRDAIVATTIIPRMTVYKEFEVVLSNIDPNLRKDRLTEIINERIKHYYHNALMLWFAAKLIENKYNLNNINISRFYAELSPNISIKTQDFQLSAEQDLTPISNISDITIMDKFNIKITIKPLIFRYLTIFSCN